ncbi:MAG: hypothetical protein K1X95_07820 [Acidimicrobiia bacterium]|nr:hypothetical protein [Acidimicrobiia bacterium]
MTRTARTLTAVAITIAGLALAVPAAGQTSGPPTTEPKAIIGGDDATDLAATLARATEVQGVCYGWEVNVDGATSASSVGSNAGAGKSVGENCPSKVVFVASITYTSESSESEDKAAITVEAPAGGPTTDDLVRLGITPAALLGDGATDTVYNGTAVLPMLMAEKGLAPVVPPRTEGAVPADAQVDESPGDDFVRTNGLPLLILGGLVLLGLVILVWALLSRDRKRGGDAPAKPTTGPPAPPQPAVPPPQGPAPPAPPTPPLPPTPPTPPQSPTGGN